MLDASPRTYVIIQNFTNSSLSLKQYTREVAMKPTMFVLTIAVAAFMMACNTTTPTGPLGDAVPSVQQVAKAAPNSNRIPLSGMLRDITYVGSYLTQVEISGYVDYTTVRLQGNLFDLHLVTNARLQDVRRDEPGIVVQTTENHQVTVSEEGVAFLETYHVLPGSNRVLYIQLQITQGTVEVADLWLDCPTCQ